MRVTAQLGPDTRRRCARIAAYLGKSSKFDEVIADFAESYADLNERDHATFAAAVDAGRVDAAPVGA